MKKLLSSILLVFIIFIFFPQIASADLANPNYYTAKCNSGEIEVECSWSRSSLNSPINDGCARYKKDPNYRFLEGEGHSFGGRQKFCFKAASTADFINYHVKALLPLLLITLLLEMPIFLVLVFRGCRALFTVLTANLISAPLFYLATIFLPFTGFMMLVVMELTVIIFEALFIKLILNEIGFRKILIYSFVANAVSAILGGILLNFNNGLIRV